MQKTSPLTQDLKVALIQSELVWQDPAANRARFASLIDSAANADLILLPEMFTAGFGMDPQRFAEPPESVTLQWMADQAAQSGAVICGSYGVAVEGGVVNRLIWMRPDGTHAYYDKRHLFRMAGEHQRYRAGKDKLIVELNGWRVCPMVCYDLRFPVWCRNRNDYDLLIFVANWPAPRAEHWRALLKARAIENLACVAAVNRVGVDGNGLEYSGDSALIDAQGEILLEPKSAPGVFWATLESQRIMDYRKRFPADLDADKFMIDDAP